MFYSFWHFRKTVELVEAEVSFFGTTLPKTVDFANSISFDTKAHSLSHSGSYGNGRFPRPRKRFAHEAGRLLGDRNELCFVNEKVSETFENRMRYYKFFSLGICTTFHSFLHFKLFLPG